MAFFEIVCLANSLKHGGRCVAGFKTNGSGWIRPISPKINGKLYRDHYTLNNQREIELFDIVKIECTQPISKPHQPENWLINDRFQWKFIKKATVDQLNKLLTQEIRQASSFNHIFGDQSDRISWEFLQQNPASASLCLIRPQEVVWRINTYSDKRKYRVKFTLNSVFYDLGITDPHWISILEKLPDGDHDAARVIDELELENFDPERFLFTLSLGEPFQPYPDGGFYCFKLVAAVINSTYVRALLNP